MLHFNFVQFWDGRAADLADQAKGPPTNPVEMGSHSWDDIVARFEMDEEFKKAFLKRISTSDERNFNSRNW